MPAKDIFHEAVKRALQKDQWTITHDPYWIKLADSDINMYTDLAAERIMAAERSGEKIAVEVKSFVGNSFIAEFHEALGKFLDYRVALREKESERQIYLAITLDTYHAFFARRFIQTVCQEYQVKLLIFDPQQEEVSLWKK